MKIFNLGEIDNDHIDIVGGKARGLDNLIKQGFNVPHGFVLIDVNINTDLEIATSYFLESGLENVAVRSSATAEDGADYSYAGQFKTFLNVDNAKDFKNAVEECINSLTDDVAKTYTDQFGKQTDTKMSIVVQEMISPNFAGVCFTIDPKNSNNYLIESVEGLGEALVSGAVAATQYSIPLNIIELDDVAQYDLICIEKKQLSAQMLRELCSQALRMQKSFNMPLDTEWAIRDNILHWLQARPITVIETCEEDEFDPKENLANHTITRCNIGEMLPGAITPLTWSVSLFAIDWGLREMLRVAGAVKRVDDLPPYSCALSVSGHLFMNLSTLYRLANAAFLADKENIDFSICGRALDEKGIIPGKKAWFVKRFINTIKYIRFISSRNKARKKLEKIADNFVIYNGQNCTKALYNAINDVHHIAGHVSYLHYITSAHSGAMASAVIQTLDKKYNDRERCKEILAELLQWIDGIESVDILASLRRIARAILAENPSAKGFSNKELINLLKNANVDVQNTHKEFINRHGHRSIREAELRSKGWADDEDAFIGYLKTVITGGVEEEEKHTIPDFKAIVKEHGFKGTKAKILVYLIKNAREGVKNREYSKSKLIKVLDGFKKAYARLAEMLVEQGRLPDADAIYFLTHQEIGQLVDDENAKLTKKSIQRRRLLSSQSELRFNEIYLGKPNALPPPDISNMDNTLRGTAISRGVATGPARIVRNVEDAAKLQKGEIMVAVYTDIGWSPYYCLIEGLVTEIGSALSHGAVVAREYALPFVSNIAGATALIKTGDIISVNGATGTVTRL